MKTMRISRRIWRNQAQNLLALHPSRLPTLLFLLLLHLSERLILLPSFSAHLLGSSAPLLPAIPSRSLPGPPPSSPSSQPPFPTVPLPPIPPLLNEDPLPPSEARSFSSVAQGRSQARSRAPLLLPRRARLLPPSLELSFLPLPLRTKFSPSSLRLVLPLL